MPEQNSGNKFKGFEEVEKMVENGVLKKPKDASKEDFGHALILLKSLRQRVLDGETKEQMELNAEEIRKRIETGTFPDNTFDLLGYEEEPDDLRE